MLVYRLLRAGESVEGGGLCNGAEDGAREWQWSRRGCDQANIVECANCKVSWEPEDTFHPGRCPECNRLEHIRVKRCEQCPLNVLDEVRRGTRIGRFLDRVLELDYVLSMLSVDWRDVRADEMKGVQILRDEREKLKAEQLERFREQQKQEFEAHMRGANNRPSMSSEEIG